MCVWSIAIRAQAEEALHSRINENRMAAAKKANARRRARMDYYPTAGLSPTRYGELRRLAPTSCRLAGMTTIKVPILSRQKAARQGGGIPFVAQY
jgi:hypothetical protein